MNSLRRVFDMPEEGSEKSGAGRHVSSLRKHTGTRQLVETLSPRNLEYPSMTLNLGLGKQNREALVRKAVLLSPQRATARSAASRSTHPTSHLTPDSFFRESSALG